MARARSFPPLARKDARVLILGSMPGVASLRERQYYAHAQNQFWPIMGRLFSAGRELDYEERVRALVRQRVAVWDVLKSCEREGSLDGDIDPASERPNDFRRFFDEHPQVRSVFFNGGKAQAAFTRHVLPRLPALPARLSLVRLPSTSPAHAGMPRAAKLRAWQQVRRAL
jgi:hypoxanthine-DNA glycosylase